jgi:AmpD protein
MKWSPDRKTALAEANVNPFSLGIELVGTQDSGFTDKQLASLYQLLEHLVVRYKVQPDRVVGHCHVSPGRKIDPDGTDRQFNWTKTWQVCHAAYLATGGKIP